MYISWLFQEFVLELLSMPIKYVFPRNPRLAIVIIFVCLLGILVVAGIANKIDGFDDFLRLISPNNNDLFDLTTISSSLEFLRIAYFYLVLLMLEYGGIWIIYFFLASNSVTAIRSSEPKDKNAVLSFWIISASLTFLKMFSFSWISFCYIYLLEKPGIMEFQAFLGEISDPISKSARWLANKEIFFIVSLLTFGLEGRLATIFLGNFLPIIHTVVAIESSLLEEKNKLLSYWIILTTFSFLELLLENFLFFWLEG
eukprot:GHVP01052752.1.p1 GENE.GHVP01052752.1~~GHVP01052752.1.p1  ORF type:complete len:256 (+),score=39.40 GHVP01052752.1:150-917(+)